MVDTGITVDTAGLVQISNIRMDSVKNYGLNVINSSGCIFSNINIDYCQKNAFLINGGGDNVFRDVSSRCGTLYPYNTTSGTLMSAAVANTHPEAAVFCFNGSGTYYNNKIDSVFKVSNPMDSSSNYLVPINFVTFTGSGTHKNYSISCSDAPNSMGTISNPFNTLDPNYVNAIVNTGTLTNNIEYSGTMYGLPIKYAEGTIYKPVYSANSGLSDGNTSILTKQTNAGTTVTFTLLDKPAGFTALVIANLNQNGSGVVLITRGSADLTISTNPLYGASGVSALYDPTTGIITITSPRNFSYFTLITGLRAT